jgi:DNA-binding transcriptional LysR family regulator
MVKKRDVTAEIGAFAVGDRVGRMLIGPGLTARALEIFLAVANRGSMSAAAQHLKLTQPAISQAVMGMEAALNVQLFDRSVRPPVLTLQATALLGPAQTVIDSLKDLENAVLLGRMAPLPSLRIGMLNSFAAAIGPVILGHLRDIAAELRVESGFQATRIQALASRDYDFLITADESPLPPNVEVLPLLTEPFLIVLPTSYKGDVLDLTQVSAQLEFIGSGRDPIMLSRFDRTLQSRGVALRSRYHLDTSEAVLQMVATGVGWTIQPPLAVYRALARGETIQVAGYPDDTLKRTIVVAFRAGEQRVALQIQVAALEVLRRQFMPQVKAFMPTVFQRVRLHKN